VPTLLRWKNFHLATELQICRTDELVNSPSAQAKTEGSHQLPTELGTDRKDSSQ